MLPPPDAEQASPVGIASAHHLCWRSGPGFRLGDAGFKDWRAKGLPQVPPLTVSFRTL
jgi:hypothetical protein